MTDEALLARSNAISTYVGLALAVNGTTVSDEHGFTLCQGPREISFCNFAAGFDIASEQEAELVVEHLVARTRDVPATTTFVMTGDRPGDLGQRLVDAGFESHHTLHQMVDHSASAVSGTELEEAVQPADRLLVTRFMAEQFFWRAGQGLREQIAQATAATTHRLYWAGTRHSPSVAVMLVESEGAIGLYNLCVRPEDRGAGWGSEAVRFAQRLAAARSSALCLQCDSALKEWYSRHGFDPVGEARAFHFVSGEASDILGLRE